MWNVSFVSIDTFRNENARRNAAKIDSDACVVPSIIKCFNSRMKMNVFILLCRLNLDSIFVIYSNSIKPLESNGLKVHHMNQALPLFTEWKSK